MNDKKDDKSVLRNISTKAPISEDKKRIKALTKEMYVEIEELHKRMRAEDKHSLLLVFQGMDAAGKDGSIDKLYNGLYPMATEANAFKAPNNTESSHDFLWRIHKLTPPTGHIGIFNRSHYEDILVPTVHGLFDEDTINKRYDHINNFEELLQDNNTHVIKFYLHISKEEQKARFNERKVLVEKRWKYNKNDIRESKLWDKYMDVYEEIFSKSKIPWNIVPADNKWYRNYIIAQRVLHKLLSLDMKYPEEIAK
jgi:PPK2 family polyphosphate:nucleotide phosphotransferase